MRLPDEIEQIIEEKVKNISLNELREKAKNLSDRYMNDERKGQSLIDNKLDALVYSIIRMPSTYCTVKSVIEKSLIDKNDITSFIDFGAGTGAATLAINELLNIKYGICIERESNMQILGEEYIKLTYPNIDIDWLNVDIEKIEINKKADLVISSYMLNEIKKENRLNLVKRLLKCSNKYLIIIEPGTPEGFFNIKEIQNYAVDNKIKIIGPCVKDIKCKLPENDWCHSIVRVERNKLHKFLKDGDAPFEDEKFSYIVLSKIENCEEHDNKDINDNKSINYRILRHPIIEKGKITVKICSGDKIEDKVITKKQKEIYKNIRKKKCGDLI